jgi:hypothetical protein
MIELCSIISQYSTYYYSNDRSTLKLQLPGKISPFQENQILNAFVHTLLLGRISSKERLAKEDFNKILRMDPLIAFAQTNETHYLGKICKAFEEGSRLRRILVTEKGYIGSAPRTLEEGDIICVLFGCSVPVVLRKVHDEVYFEYVGECYLHNFMDAEAIALQIRGALKEQDFVLI